MTRFLTPILSGIVLAALSTGSVLGQDPQKPSDSEPAKNAEEPKGRGLLDSIKNVGGKLSDSVRKEGGKIANAAHKEGKHLAETAHKGGGKLSGAFQEREAGAVAWIKKSPVYKYLQARGEALFMESPQLIKVNPDKPGSPVYYINGMLTVKAQAIREAEALSNDLNRPVYLIRNPTFLEGSTGTPTCADDLSESIYDKTWPERLVGIKIDDVIRLLSAPNPPFAQLNPTTRQITYVIYHAGGPVAIVSHSQGCLMVRNALLATALLDRESTVRHEVAWVATGTPVNDKEVWPMPAKYHYEINATDPVPALIGTRGGPGAKDSLRYPARDHEPIRNYFPRIQPSMLFP